ncbi:MAG TPA: VIT1/CCC1 transporter family protein [Parachlamydiaceae bacterium]|nr:VIT1/CCC1 transporter family protein [Parachlamydiaceae bacterium]
MSHFKGKEAISHVTENCAKGIIASSEIHGTEIPGAISAASDAAKESALFFLFLWTILISFNLPLKSLNLALLSFSLGILLWKTARSAFLGFSRLERLHRIASQEKWEIEHNREEEREELTALYAAKGFSGKLLKDVIDVLMSDGDTLLRVMIEEELGLSLEVHEHPLKQAFGAFCGSFLSFLTCFLALWLFPLLGSLIAALLITAISSFIAAKFERNDLIHAVTWNLGMVGASYAALYFFMHYLQQAT